MTSGTTIVRTTTIEIGNDGGRPFDGHLAWPERVTGPGVIVLSEMFGVNDAMRRVADHFARRGSPALVPNLFWRSETTRAFAYDVEQQEAWTRLAALDLDAAAREVQTALSWFRVQPAAPVKMAGVGFCGGGRIAFLAAARTDIDAAASLYGLGIAQHLDEAGSVSCPLQIHYGLNDRHIPREEIDTVAAAVKSQPLIGVFLYPGAGHSFFNPVRPTYDPDAAALAASRIEGMIDDLAR